MTRLALHWCMLYSYEIPSEFTCGPLEMWMGPHFVQYLCYVMVPKMYKSMGDALIIDWNLREMK